MSDCPNVCNFQDKKYFVKINMLILFYDIDLNPKFIYSDLDMPHELIENLQKEIAIFQK